MIYMSKQRGLCSGLNRFLDPKFQDFFQSLFVSKQASLPPVTVKWAITRGGCLGEVSTIGLGLGNFSVLNRWLIKNRTGLKIATDTVAYATNIFSLATKNSGLVAKVATRFLYDLDLN